MAENRFPEAVRTLILTRITSVWQLEILLHLYSIRPRFVELRDLSHVLRMAPEPLFDQVRELQARGLVVPSPTGQNAFAYYSASPEQDQAVGALADLYKDHHVSIVGLIYSRPTEKIRTFADAFRLRQEKEPPS